VPQGEQQDSKDDGHLNPDNQAKSAILLPLVVLDCIHLTSLLPEAFLTWTCFAPAAGVKLNIFSSSVGLIRKFLNVVQRQFPLGEQFWGSR